MSEKVGVHWKTTHFVNQAWRLRTAHLQASENQNLETKCYNFARFVRPQPCPAHTLEAGL